MKKSRRKEFLEILSENPIVRIACQRSGLSRNTVYRWRKEDSVFKEKMDEALSQGVDSACDLCESKLLADVTNGNQKAYMYYLNNHKPEYRTPRDPNYWPKLKELEEKVDAIEIHIVSKPEEVIRKPPIV